MKTARSTPRFSRLLALTLGVVVVGLVALWAAVAVLLPASRMRPLLLRQLGHVLSRDVRFGAVRVTIWPPVRVTLDDAALAEPGGFGAGVMLETRALHLDLDAFALLRNRMVVQRLVIDNPALHLVLRPDGTTNLDGIGKTKAQAARAPRAPMDLSVGELVIANAQVLVDDLGPRRRIAFRADTRLGLGIRGGGRYATDGRTVITQLAHGPLGAARLADLDASLAALRWQIDHRGRFEAGERLLTLDQLALRLGGTTLAVSGTVRDPGPRAVLDLRARGNGVSLGPILGFLARSEVRGLRGIRGQGALAFDLRIRGRIGSAPSARGGAGADRSSAGGAGRLPDVIGSLRLVRGGVQLAGAPARVEDLAFSARFAPDSLGISNLTARVARQPIRAALSMTRFADPRVAFTVQGDVDLAAVAPLLVPKDGTLAGRAAVNLSGRGRARDPGAMAINGRARLAGVRVTSPDLPKPIEQLQGTIDFSRTRARATGISARAGTSVFVIDATIDRPLALMSKPADTPRPAPAGVDFQVRAASLDLADVMPQGGGGLVLPHARGKGRIAISKFKNGRLEMANLRADVALEPGAVTAPRFSGTVFDGLATGSARLDASDPARPTIGVKARLDSARVERLLGTWVPPGNWLNGGLNTRIDLDAHLADLRHSLTAVGLAAMWNGTLGPTHVLERLAKFTQVPAFAQVKFRDLESTFRIQRGRVFTGPAVLDGPHGEWLIGGSVGLDGTLDYAVSITLPPAIANELGVRSALAAGALADDRGRVLMDFRITGPAQAPRIAWDPTAMRARVEGRVSDAIEEQRTKIENAVRDTVETQVRAAQDSARAAGERYRRALEDSLRRKTRGLLEGFFSGPKDTTRR